MQRVVYKCDSVVYLMQNLLKRVKPGYKGGRELALEINTYKDRIKILFKDENLKT